jgi:hypothetical protein
MAVPATVNGVPNGSPGLTMSALTASRTCPVIGVFLVTWDSAGGAAAGDVAALAALAAGTRSTSAVEKRRAWLAYDWLIRTQAPAWLELDPALRRFATALRALPPALDEATVDQAWLHLDPAQWSAAVASLSAWPASRGAERARSRDVAKAAVGAAACFAAARAAERTSYYPAALAAAVNSSRAAARASFDRGLDATVERLRHSAADLVRRMTGTR